MLKWEIRLAPAPALSATVLLSPSQHSIDTDTEVSREGQLSSPRKEPFTTYLAVTDTSTAFALKNEQTTSPYTLSQFLQTKTLTGVRLGPVTNHCVTRGRVCPSLGPISEVSGFELQDLPFETMRLGYVFIHPTSQRGPDAA